MPGGRALTPPNSLLFEGPSSSEPTGTYEVRAARAGGRHRDSVLGVASMYKSLLNRGKIKVFFCETSSPGRKPLVMRPEAAFRAVILVQLTFGSVLLLLRKRGVKNLNVLNCSSGLLANTLLERYTDLGRSLRLSGQA